MKNILFILIFIPSIVPGQLKLGIDYDLYSGIPSDGDFGNAFGTSFGLTASYPLTYNEDNPGMVGRLANNGWSDAAEYTGTLFGFPILSSKPIFSVSDNTYYFTAEVLFYQPFKNFLVYPKAGSVSNITNANSNTA